MLRTLQTFADQCLYTRVLGTCSTGATVILVHDNSFFSAEWNRFAHAVALLLEVPHDVFFKRML